MPLDPRIALAGIQPQFSLMDLGAVLGQGQRLQAGQLALGEQSRQLEEAERVRQAYAQQYGGSAGGGLAGAPPPAAAGVGEAPVHERQLGGGPTAMAPYAPQPAGGPKAPQGLGALGGATGSFPGAGPSMGGPAEERAFINQLYTISPKAGREAEAHSYATRELQLKSAQERVAYLGRIADGVLEVDTQEAYNVGRRMLIEAGMPPGQMPEVYDKNLMRLYAGVARDSQDKLRMAQAQAALAKEQRERNLQAAKAPDYGYGDAVNAAIYARYGDQIPPGSPPTPAQVRQAQADVQEGKVAVSEATGAKGAEAKALGQTAQKRLEDLDKAGLTAQTTHTTLDELDRLMGEGIYGNSPQDRLAMAAYRAGTRPNDTKAQRTARLQELGNELVLAHGSLGSGVSAKDAEIYAKAAGNFQQAKNPQEMVESIKSMRTILNKAIDYANKTRESYEQTGKLPPFEGRAQPAPGAAGGGGAAARPLPTTVEEIDRELADIERQLGGR